MIHNKLIHTLEKAGFEDTGMNSLKLMDEVAELMQVEEGSRNEWIEVYMENIKKAENMEGIPTRAEFTELAKESFAELLQVLNGEARANSQ